MPARLWPTGRWLAEGAAVSRERHELLATVLPAKMTDSEEFRPFFQAFSQQAHSD